MFKNLLQFFKGVFSKFKKTPEAEGLKTALKQSGILKDPKKSLGWNLRHGFVWGISLLILGTGGFVFKDKITSFFIHPPYSAEDAYQLPLTDNNQGTAIVAGTSTVNSVLLDTAPSSKQNCKYWKCVNFSDWTEWTSHRNLKIDKLTRKICVIKIGKEKGGTIFLKEPYVEKDFTLHANFNPLGSKEFNTVLVWGDNFDFIVGDATLDRIAVKTPAGYVTPEGNAPDHNHYTLEQPIRSNTPVDLKLAVKLNSFETLKLLPTISYTTNIGGTVKDLELPAFIASTTKTTWAIQERVGIKLADPNNRGDICTIFNDLDVEAN